MPAQTEPPPWDDLRILLAVHRGKSFLAAGRQLRVATSTVARRIEALERALGRAVVHRGNSGTVIAPDALALVALGEQMELGLEAVRRDTRADSLSGTVRISASEGFVRGTTAALARVKAKHPSLAFELMAESRVVDLARREADIGLRITRTPSPTVIEKSMGRASVALFAARSYIERCLPGARLRRDDAARHDWVGLDRSLERLPQERWMRSYGASRFVFRSNSAGAIEEAVLAGLGIGLLGVARGAELDRLVRIETDEAPPSVDVFIAIHRDAKREPRVRVVLNELEASIRRALN